MSEKTEKPTSKRLKEARLKGQVVKSVEIISGFQLATVIIVFVLFFGGWLDSLQALIIETLNQINVLNENTIGNITVLWGKELANILGILAVFLFVVTVFVLFSQVGIVFSTKVYEEFGKKLNVIANIKQMFSKANLFELLKSLLKITVIGTIFYFIIREHFSTFQQISLCGYICGLPFFSTLCFQLFIGLLVSYILFAIADYSFQRHRTMKQLMMTKEEVKQEYKDSEGNQEIKQRRKEIHREIQHDNVQQKIRKSSVVIKNPTHISICLWFDAKQCPLPKVIAKGEGKRAKWMNKMAEKEGIPVVENIVLARGLNRQIEEGEFITSDFFEPVAEILRIVMNIPYDPEDD